LDRFKGYSLEADGDGVVIAVEEDPGAELGG